MSDKKTPQTAADFDADALLALLEEQLDLYKQLGSLAGNQRSLITGDEPERLLEVLAQRQGLLDRLENVASRLRPYQERWRELRPGMNEVEGQRVDGLLAEINRRLAEILVKDKADADLLAARKSSTAKAMANQRQVRQVGAAYAAQAGTAGPRVEWTGA